jgi:hypothetical protein
MDIRKHGWFKHINWNPDRSELTRFALAMIIGFGALGAVAAVQSGMASRTSTVLWIAGSALAVLAQLPIVGRSTYLIVYVASSLLGGIVSRLVLFLIFSFVFIPIGAVLRARGKDFLGRRKTATLWQPIYGERPSSSYYHQF